MLLAFERFLNIIGVYLEYNVFEKEVNQKNMFAYISECGRTAHIPHLSSIYKLLT